MKTTRDMSDAHEKYLAESLGGRQTKGSGNQWHNAMDGRQSSLHQEFAFAWDGKSTYSASVGVSISMWEKAREQSGRERTCIPLRFYADGRGTVRYDLIVASLADFTEMQQAANRMSAIEAQGCLRGLHDYAAVGGDLVCAVCGSSSGSADL